MQFWIHSYCCVSEIHLNCIVSEFIESFSWPFKLNSTSCRDNAISFKLQPMNWGQPLKSEFCIALMYFQLTNSPMHRFHTLWSLLPFLVLSLSVCLHFQGWMGRASCRPWAGTLRSTRPWWAQQAPGPPPRLALPVPPRSAQGRGPTPPRGPSGHPAPRSKLRRVAAAMPSPPTPALPSRPCRPDYHQVSSAIQPHTHNRLTGQTAQKTSKQKKKKQQHSMHFLDVLLRYPTRSSGGCWDLTSPNRHEPTRIVETAGKIGVFQPKLLVDL